MFRSLLGRTPKQEWFGTRLPRLVAGAVVFALLCADGRARAQGIDETKLDAMVLIVGTRGDETLRGSGFIVALSPDRTIATILTSSHVIAGARFTVTFYADPNQTPVPVTEVIQLDQENRDGLGLFRVRRDVPANATALEIMDRGDPFPLRGQSVQLLGYPNMGPLSTATRGYAGQNNSLYLVDLGVGEGSSGGPVLSGGKVFGLVTNTTDLQTSVVPFAMLRLFLEGARVPLAAPVRTPAPLPVPTPTTTVVGINEPTAATTPPPAVVATTPAPAATTPSPEAAAAAAASIAGAPAATPAAPTVAAPESAPGPVDTPVVAAASPAVAPVVDALPAATTPVADATPAVASPPASSTATATSTPAAVTPATTTPAASTPAATATLAAPVDASAGGIGLEALTHAMVDVTATDKGTSVHASGIVIAVNAERRAALVLTSGHVGDQGEYLVTFATDPSKPLPAHWVRQGSSDEGDRWLVLQIDAGVPASVRPVDLLASVPATSETASLAAYAAGDAAPQVVRDRRARPRELAIFILDVEGGVTPPFLGGGLFYGDKLGGVLTSTGAARSTAFSAVAIRTVLGSYRLYGQAVVSTP